MSPLTVRPIIAVALVILGVLALLHSIDDLVVAVGVGLILCGVGLVAP